MGENPWCPFMASKCMHVYGHVYQKTHVYAPRIYHHHHPQIK